MNKIQRLSSTRSSSSKTTYHVNYCDEQVTPDYHNVKDAFDYALLILGGNHFFSADEPDKIEIIEKESKMITNHKKIYVGKDQKTLNFVYEP